MDSTEHADGTSGAHAIGSDAADVVQVVAATEIAGGGGLGGGSGETEDDVLLQEESEAVALAQTIGVRQSKRSTQGVPPRRDPWEAAGFNFGNASSSGSGNAVGSTGAAASAGLKKRTGGDRDQRAIKLNNGGHLLAMSFDDVQALVGKDVVIYARWVLPRFKDYWPAKLLRRTELDDAADGLEASFDVKWLDDGTTYSSTVRFIRVYDGPVIDHFDCKGLERQPRMPAAHQARLAKPARRAAKRQRLSSASDESEHDDDADSEVSVRIGGATGSAAQHPADSHDGVAGECLEDCDNTSGHDSDSEDEGGIGSAATKASMLSAASKSLILAGLSHGVKRGPGRPSNPGGLKSAFIPVVDGDGKGRDSMCRGCNKRVSFRTPSNNTTRDALIRLHAVVGWVCAEDKHEHGSACEKVRSRTCYHWRHSSGRGVLGIKGLQIRGSDGEHSSELSAGTCCWYRTT